MRRRLRSASKTEWDRFGYWASFACAIHCLAAPIVVLALPAFAQVWSHPASHALMAVAVVPLALAVVLSGYRKHRQRWILGAASLGIICVVTGSALPYLPVGEATAVAPVDGACDSCCPTIIQDASGTSRVYLPPASIVTLIGSLLLAGAHFGNRGACRRCERGACSPGQDSGESSPSYSMAEATS